MSTVKTSELTGAALNWAVAKCEGVTIQIHSAADITARILRSLSPDEAAQLGAPIPYCVIPGIGHAEYSTNWALGGPIIER